MGVQHHGLVSDGSVCGDGNGTGQKVMERVHDYPRRLTAWIKKRRMFLHHPSPFKRGSRMLPTPDLLAHFHKRKQVPADVYSFTTRKHSLMTVSMVQLHVYDGSNRSPSGFAVGYGLMGSLHNYGSTCIT